MHNQSCHDGFSNANSKKIATFVYAPPCVYQLSRTTISDTEGRTAAELASQVISALCESSLELPQFHLSFLAAHHADGQYQCTQFRNILLSSTQRIYEYFLTNQQEFFVTPWDISHWLDLSMVKVRGKICQKFFHR